MKRNLITITSRMISLLMIINLLTGIGGVSAAVIRIEAEDAVFGGEAHVFTNMPGASGNSLVGDIHKAGCYVQFDNLPASKTVRICYASINSGNISIYLNNYHVWDAEFSTTNGWNGVGNFSFITLDMNINSGDSLKIQFDSGDEALNVDYIECVSALSVPQTPVRKGIAAGAYHTAVVDSNGKVLTCGDNRWGQLGNNGLTGSAIPVRANVLKNVEAVAAGGNPMTYRFHTAAVKSDGTVWTWGSNTNGQLGNSMTTAAYVPIQVTALSGVVAVSCGGTHTVALKSDGTVWTWGDNEYGQLGNGTTVSSSVPVKINTLTDITAIAAGGQHTVALKSDGTVWTWGNNTYGQLGNGTTTDSSVPVMAQGLEDAAYVATGFNHTIALKSDGTVWTWGNNYTGQLGHNLDSTTVPTQVSGLTDVTAVAGGFNHTVSLKSDGTVWAWGNNSSGQLGDGTTTASTAPVQVTALTDAAEIAAGSYHTVALKSDGTVWTWGENSFGQLGNGTTTGESSPVQMAEKAPYLPDVWTDYAAGQAPELSGNTYLIKSAADLAWVAVEVNYYSNTFEGYSIKINANIDLSAHQWVPIGSAENPFSGSVDGNNKTISNMNIGTTDFLNEPSGICGLFGYMVLDSEAYIKDIRLDNIAVYVTIPEDRTAYIGGLAGRMTNGTISNCHVSGFITTENYYDALAAGLIAYKENGIVKDCSSAVDLSSEDNTGIGGVVGFNFGTVQNCYNTGSLTGGDGAVVGGVAVINAGIVQGCYNTGSLTGGNGCGIGGVTAWNFGTVQYCYNTGSLTGGDDANPGGVTAQNEGGVVQNNYFLQDTMDLTPINPGIYGDGYNFTNNGAEPKTAVYMRSAEFISGLNTVEAVFCADFAGSIALNNGYPIFTWQAEYALGLLIWQDFAAGEAPALVDDTYLIEDAADLAWVAAEVNYNSNTFEGYSIKINANIDLSAHQWVPIGSAENPFSGSFDGNNKTISNLKIGNQDMPNDRLIKGGLFGYMELAPDSFVKDVLLDNIAYYITLPGNDSGTVGGLAGEITDGTVTGCRVSGVIVADVINFNSFSYAAGLVGYMAGGSIESCLSSVEISGGYGVGVSGIAGYNLGMVQGCCNTGSLTSGSFTSIAGIVLENEGTVENCCNTGILTGGEYAEVSGVVTYNYEGIVQNCYNTGDLHGLDDACIGGVVGYNYEGMVQNCYNTGNLTGGADVSIGGIVFENEGNVQGCYNTGSLTGGDDAIIGGIALINEDNSTLKGCYNTGNLTGGDCTEIGGIVWRNNDSTVQGCYNTGNLTGGIYAVIGGVVSSNSGTVHSCYNIGRLEGGTYSYLGGVAAFDYRTLENTYFLQDIYDIPPINPDLYGVAYDYSGGMPAASNEGAEPKTAYDMRDVEFTDSLNSDEVFFCPDLPEWIGLYNGYPILTWQSYVMLKYSNGTVMAASTAALERATLVMASYIEGDQSGKKLACIKVIEDISLTAGEFKPFFLDPAMNDILNAGGKVKIFLWEDATNMKPLTNPVEIAGVQ